MAIVLSKSPDKLNKKTRIKRKIKKKRRHKYTRKNKKACKKKYKKKLKNPNNIILKDTTPKVLKVLRKKIHKHDISKVSHSFKPNVNQLINSLKSISPHREIGLNFCKEDELYIRRDADSGQCYSLNSKIAQTYMIDNLLSNKPINCNTIIAPKQVSYNCWFNAFFMVFFVSDKGRDFFRYLRLAMITGKLPNGSTIPTSLRMPFLLLNKYIEASLLGSDSKTHFTKLSGVENRLADVMDTNIIIRKIAQALGKKKRAEYGIVKTRVSSNPMQFYDGIIDYLKDSSISLVDIDTYPTTINIAAPDIFVFSGYSEDTEEKIYIKREFTVIQGNNKLNYKLDSAVLRDTHREHFSSYITCNGKPFGFDGESFSRMVPFNWFKKLNVNTQWRFAKQYDTYFNFTNGAYLLFYYRIQ